MLAFYTVVWTMHSEDDRAFFQQLYIDYEIDDVQEGVDRFEK